MTSKKTNSKEKESTPPKKEASKEKLILLEVVNEYPERMDIKIGALSRAGLLTQYRYEESVHEKEEIKPSITVDEFTKILKDYLGE